MDEFDELRDVDIFSLDDITVEYKRSKDRRRVTTSFEGAREISEMKLYLLLDQELRKLELRLGIHDEDRTLKH